MHFMLTFRLIGRPAEVIFKLNSLARKLDSMSKGPEAELPEVKIDYSKITHSQCWLAKWYFISSESPSYGHLRIYNITTQYL